MPHLSLPTTDVQKSFLAAMGEFVDEGRGDEDDDTMVGSEIRNFSATWDSPEGFAAYVAWMCGQSIEESPRPEGHVPATTYWWLDGEEYLGRIAIRHRITPRLLELGGHIGYDVRPSARRRGHATAMLKEGLTATHALGIDPALVICDYDNVGSRKVIEACGGVFEDQRGIRLRFWVPTS